MSFARQVIWITGASSGIGAALAVELSRYGASLVLSSRHTDQLEQLREQLVWPDNHLVLPLDLAAPDSFAQALDQVIARFGRVDILVNNGGISQRSRAAETSIEVDRRIMEVNFFGAVGLTRAVLPVMREQGGGHIVVVSSLVGELPTPMRSSYCASKHALHGWFESLRSEEYIHNIKVLMVMPGFVRTRVSINALTADGSAHGQMDEYQAKGMSAALCAERIVQAMQQGKDQVMIAGREGLAIYLKRWFPWLYRQIIRRIKVT